MTELRGGCRRRTAADAPGTMTGLRRPEGR